MRQETGPNCSLAQRGSPDPQSGDSRRGFTTALMTHTFGESYRKLFGPLASSDLACAHTASLNPELWELLEARGEGLDEAPGSLAVQCFWGDGIASSAG